MKKNWAVKLLTGMSIILLGFGFNGMECQASLDNQTIGQEGPRGRLGRSDETDVEGQEGRIQNNLQRIAFFIVNLTNWWYIIINKEIYGCGKQKEVTI